MRSDRRPPWLMPYEDRKKVSKKFKDTESKIREAKDKGDWHLAIRLKRLLMKAWWGIKRYKNKS